MTKCALAVQGGWDGHIPVAASDKYAAVLKDDGYDVERPAAVPAGARPEER